MARINGDADPIRCATAAHELGHLIAWQRAGLTILSISVSGYGFESQGRVRLGRQRITDPTQTRLYLVGLLTGRIAELRWCRLNNLTIRGIEYTCAADIKVYRKLRRRTRFPHRDLVVEAGALVRGNWKEIARRTPRLARNGSLAV